MVTLICGATQRVCAPRCVKYDSITGPRNCDLVFFLTVIHTKPHLCSSQVPNLVGRHLKTKSKPGFINNIKLRSSYEKLGANLFIISNSKRLYV